MSLKTKSVGKYGSKSVDGWKEKLTTLVSMDYTLLCYSFNPLIDAQTKVQ